MTELEQLLYEACKANNTMAQLAWWDKWSPRAPGATNQMALTLLTMEEAVRLANGLMKKREK